MKLAGKSVWVIALLIVLVLSSARFFFAGEPYFSGRPVSHWALDYSQKLYPSGTVPLSPSQEGLDALRKMGAQKASIALVHALMHGDTKLYAKYRSIYPRLPSWYQNRFPLRLTHQQKVTLILGATDFLDAEYQKAMVPFVITYLEMSDPEAQIAACELLAAMPRAASPAQSALNHLITSPELQVSQAAQAAADSFERRSPNVSHSMPISNDGR